MVTVQPPLAAELLTDDQLQAKKIGQEFADRRGDHLRELGDLETMVRQAAPLPISYDVARMQGAFFNEFTYTELMGGGLLVSPMSNEVAARMVQVALDRPDQGFDAASAVLAQRQDKYRLSDVGLPVFPAVAFLPGSNLFKEAVSWEALSRAMFENDALVIKPHPMSDQGLVQHLAREFGHHRVLEPLSSGNDILTAATTVYTLTTSEMGLYAVLMGKPIRNIGNFFNEARGSYAALYRPLWGKSPADADTTLRHVLNSPLGGFFHKDDPDLPERIDRYFAEAMAQRRLFKPLVPGPPPAPTQQAQFLPETPRKP